MINIIYRVYYGDEIVYLGRTHQELVDRIREHLFHSLKLKTLDIFRISKIEYTELETEADMFLYEIYYINKLKPVLNVDDKACDDLTYTLPELTFSDWSTPLWEKWKSDKEKERETKAKTAQLAQKEREIEMRMRAGEISSSEHCEELERIKRDKAKLAYEAGKLATEEYIDTVAGKKSISEL